MDAEHLTAKVDNPRDIKENRTVVFGLTSPWSLPLLM